MQRAEAGDERDEAAEHDRVADQRDQAAERRDRAADERDQAAARRDEAASRRDEAAAHSEAPLRTGVTTEDSDRSDHARREAASDRRQASEDRRAGASERTLAESDRNTAQADRGAGASERTLAESDRARAREELEASELRFTSGFEHSPIGIALASSAGRFLKVNPALCRMLGRDKATLLAMTFQDLTHPEDVADDKAHLQAMTSKASGSWEAEKRYLRPDGSVVWAQINSAVVPGEAGASDHVFSQIQDITERRALADAVVRDREFLAAVLHNVSDGVVACNADGVLTLLNRAAQEFTGLPATASTGKDWASHYNLYRADGITPMAPEDVPLSRAFRGEDVRDVEMVVAPRGAPRRVMRVSGQAIRDSAGRVLGAVVTMHDITEHKQAVEDLASLNADLERRVQERTAEAERANEAKSEFLSRMSHELRTPLNSMLGFTQLLGMDELRPDQAESLKHIMSGGRHLLGLINDVLDLAVIESGSLAVSMEPTALRPALEEALHLLRPQAASAAVTLPAQAPAGADVHVLADHQRLRQIVLNLLSNAVKYNCKDGTVSLSCERRNSGRLRVSVTDTGPGIAPEEAQRIFLPFERLVPADTPVEGTGLGLAVSRRLAEAMGAEVGLSSVVGEGSTFWVELTVTEKEEALPETPTATAWNPGAGTNPATVLYIEDNPSNLQLVGTLLSRLPHIRLLTADSGLAGLESAQRWVPDLILLDLGLPDISGAEVLERLRADATTLTIPVVVVSADATDSQTGRLLAAGAAAYLTKPLDVRLFFATVEETLQTDRAARLPQQTRTALEQAIAAVTLPNRLN
jgi:PAS domain S-box-containing protein